MALIQGGFKRVALLGGHGPLSSLFSTMINSIYHRTGHVVIHVRPKVMPEEEMEKKLGYTRGEDIAVLCALKVLGLHGAYDPGVAKEGRMEFPSRLINPLKKYGGSGIVPWIFQKDYQHTGLRKGITLKHADMGIAIMKKAIDEMDDLPDLFKKYQKEMAKLNKDKPWDKDTVWTI